MTKNIIFSKVSSKLLLGTSLVAMAILVMGAPGIVRADTLYRQLEVGMSGTDVSSLQTFLAQDPTIYPQGLVTGYFGFLTKSAVSNWQSANGISAVGRIGPASLPVINAQMAGGMSTGGDVNAPIISALSVNTSNSSANVSWNTSEPARGKVYYSNTPLTLSNETPKSVDISGASVMSDSALRYAQNVFVPSLQGNTTYYYSVYSTDGDGNLNLSWPRTFHTN